MPNANKKSRAAIMRNAQVLRLLQFLSLDGTNDCRFRRIILLCDPDIDGQHACYLLASLLRQIRPDWVERKAVYLSVAPLISSAVSTNTASASTGIVRYHKGIASMDADLLSELCIHKNTRQLRLLTLAGS